MLFFKRQKPDPIAEIPTAAKVQKQAVQFPGRFRTVCPETQSKDFSFYTEPAESLNLLLRDLDSGTGNLERMRWQLEVATESITMIGKRPLQAIIPLHAQNSWDWHRASYLRGLVAGIGAYLRSGAVISRSTKDTHPAILGWPEGLVQYVANRPMKQEYMVAPSISEYRVAEQIGAFRLAETLHPGVFSYFCDSFGADAWSRNPISISVAEAEEKVARILSLEGFNTLSVARLSKYKSKLSVAAAESASPTSTKPQPVPVPVAIPQNVPAPPPPVTSMAPLLNRPEPDSECAAHQQSLVDLILNRLAQGVITINEHDSMFCQVDGLLAILCPRGIKILTQMSELSEPDLESILFAMSESSKSTPSVEYRIRRKGRGWGKVRLLVLKSVYAEQIVSAATKISEPPEIKATQTE